MASKVCTPDNLYGPYEQTLFLGCSVLGFTASAGWGGQTSEVTIELVEDTCVAAENHPKKVWTAAGGAILATARQHTGPDPGFTNPNIGAPAYFRVQDFEFAGLIQSFTKKTSTSSIAYSVKLIDPRPILDHAQIILDNYQGGHQGLCNVFNVYGYLEYVNSTGGLDGNFCGDNILAHQNMGGAGTAVGAPAQGFGGARRNDRGISWTLIKQALKDLAAGPYGTNSRAYSLGALFYRQGSGGGYGELSFSNFTDANSGARYLLDISELPDPYSWDYRIAGPIVSLSEIINQVCADAGADYYVELLPTGGHLVIKVRTVFRTQVLGSSTTISDFITSKGTEAGGNGVVSNSIGRELRSDSNSTLLIGGKARQYFQQTNPEYIIPFWGFDIDGNLQQGKKITECANIEGCFPCDGTPCTENCWRVLLDFRKINLSLGVQVTLDIQNNSFGQSGFGWVLESELRMAMGDYETFKNKVINDTHKNCEYGTDTVLKRYFKETLLTQSTKSKHQLPTSERGVVQSSKPGSRITGGATEGAPPQDGLISKKVERDKQTLYNWLHAYASEYYGRKFLALVPGVCLIDSTITDPTLPITSPTNITTIYSDEPSPEGGWPSITNKINVVGNIVQRALAGAPWTDQIATIQDSVDILGLTNYTVKSDTFKDNVGKFNPILKYVSDGDLDVSELSVADYITDGSDGNGVWLKCSIDSKWVAGSPIYNDSHYNSAIDGGGRKLSALITAPARMGLGDPKAVAKTNKNATPKYPADGKPDAHLSDSEVEGVNKANGGHAATAGSVGAAFVHPIAAGVPLKSNTRTYGPWYVVGANPGSVSCEIDDGLVPWEYGGISFMNAAGIAKVQNSATSMQFGDRGEVTIPGYPNLSVGSPLTYYAPTANRPHAISSRALTIKQKQWARARATYGEVYWAMPALPAGGGASVTNINVSVGTQGVTTSYSVSTFSPVFGRFSKGNADRIKQIGLNKLSGERERRADAAVRRAVQLSEDRRIANTPILGEDPIASKSPAIWFVGKLTEDGRRKIVLSADARDLVYNTDYDNNAIMTMDGFFRPVSITGGVTDAWVEAGSGMKLPRVNQQAASNPDTYAASGYKQTTAPFPPLNEYTGLPIRQKYLDFLGDPYHNVGLFDDERSHLKHGSTTVHASFDGLNPSGGHDVEGVARRSLPDLEKYSPTENDTLLFHDGDSLPVKGSGYAGDYRFLAHRGPLVIHGWGYDVYGKPIPNASGDGGASTGNFSDTYAGLSDRFQDNWLGDARNWPVAPVDLRFDRKRGVWTIPPAFRMYQVWNTEPNSIPAGGSGPMSVLKSKDDISDKVGDAITDPTITVQNWTESSIDAGAKTLAYYDSASSEYWPIMATPSKIIAGVSKGGSAAEWDPDHMTLKSGCIEAWTFTTATLFDESATYPSGSLVTVQYSGYHTGLPMIDNHDGPHKILYTGVSGCPAQVWEIATSHRWEPSSFDEDQTLYGSPRWKRAGSCDKGETWINSGEGQAQSNGGTIGPGPFSDTSGWVSFPGSKVLNTGCTASWSHGMTTAPVQGHYVQGGGGSDILVWYDCNALPGWVTIST